MLEIVLFILTRNQSDDPVIVFAYLQHSVDAGIAVKVNKDEKTCHKIRNSKHEKSENIETSGGPVGQVTSILFELHFNDFFFDP